MGSTRSFTSSWAKPIVVLDVETAAHVQVPDSVRPFFAAAIMFTYHVDSAETAELIARLLTAGAISLGFFGESESVRQSHDIADVLREATEINAKHIVTTIADEGPLDAAIFAFLGMAMPIDDLYEDVTAYLFVNIGDDLSGKNLLGNLRKAVPSLIPAQLDLV